MKPVATLDAAMLLAETDEMPLHNLGVMILEPMRGDGSVDAYAAMRRLFAARIHRIPAFRRRVVEGPLGLGDLQWIRDPGFDLERHLLYATLPAPGGYAELVAFLGDYAGRVLERDKPLWEMVLVEGLAGGEVAVVAKIHHATMDGLHVVRMITDLFATDDRPAPSEAAREAAPERMPGVVGLLVAEARSLAGKPARLVRTFVDVASAFARNARSRDPATPAPTRRSLAVQPTPWQGALSARRAVAFGSVRLDDLLAIRSAFGTTVNDVVLAASSGALRRWLAARAALPPGPLVANVPISVKGAPGEEAGNQISMFRIALPTEEPDPLVRLARIHSETSTAKSTHRSSGANVFSRFTDFALHLTVPVLLRSAVGLYVELGGGDLHPAPWNLVVSNIPGPREPLEFAGSKVRLIVPFGPVQHGSGLNLTVMSSGDTLALGVLACRDKVPDTGLIASAFVEEIAALRALADAYTEHAETERTRER